MMVIIILLKSNDLKLCRVVSTLLVVIFIAAFESSCKKETFNHVEQDYIVPCQCCELEDSIPGIYSGRYLRFEYDGDTIIDSLIDIVVTPNIDNPNIYSDSLYCKYNLSFIETQPIVLTDNTGSYGPGTYGGDSYEMFAPRPSDSAFSLLVKRRSSVGNPWVGMFHYTYDLFEGVRQ